MSVYSIIDTHVCMTTKFSKYQAHSVYADHIIACLPQPSGIEEDEESIFEPSEDSTTEAEESGDYDFQMEEEGPRFRIGSVVSREEGDHNNPNSFAWCLMNVCISKLVQEAVRKILSIVGFEVLGEPLHF